MKKILSLFLAFAICMLGNSSIAAADGNKTIQCEEILQKIAPYAFEDGISRFECITAIMKAIGVDPCTAIRSANADRMVSPFNDVDISTHGFEVGYIYEAKIAGITFGIGIAADGISSFAPQRNITVQETLAAMLRCLNDPATIAWENTMEDSVKYGLVKEQEVSFCNPNAPLTEEQFYTWMTRFLQSACTRYFPVEQPESGWKIVMLDTSGKKTYADWYAEVQEYCKDCDRETFGSGAWHCANKNCPAEIK